MGTNSYFFVNGNRMKAVMPVRHKRNVEGAGEDRNAYGSLMGTRRRKWPCLRTRQEWKYKKMVNNDRDSIFLKD